MSELINTLNIYDIVDDYNDKMEQLPGEFERVSKEVENLGRMASTLGAYGGSPFKYPFSYNSVEALKKCLKKSAWRYVYETLNIPHIAPKTHIKQFETLLEDPPEFTIDGIRSVFKDYVVDARGMSLQAFAEIFCSLDTYYKSHSNISVGVKGLPKRVIIGWCSWEGNGWERVADVINCIARWRGRADLVLGRWDVERLTQGESGSVPVVVDINRNDKEKPIECDHALSDIKLKHFQNGNTHIMFGKQALNDINRALAEYYGKVIPDAYEHADKREESKEVSKDLQFYPTPEDAAIKLTHHIYHNRDDFSILEPSCGEGNILTQLRKKFPTAKLTGVEVHPDRCKTSRNKGFTVHCSNFLTWGTKDRFDFIVMNPPFYGKHYMKHIDRAYELLAEGGRLLAIVPISAKLNHGLIDEKYRVSFEDLPLGSFRASGTNINTTIASIYHGGKK